MTRCARRHAWPRHSRWTLVTLVAGWLVCLAAGAAGADPLPGLVAPYAFGEGSGITAADSSGNGHHGAISGASIPTIARPRTIAKPTAVTGLRRAQRPTRASRVGSARGVVGASAAVA